MATKAKRAQAQMSELTSNAAWTTFRHYFANKPQTK